MGTKLERIAEISATTKRPEFTSLYHLINTELLKQCHRELDGKKAVGIDKVTKEEYGKHLESNIADLVQRLRNKSYKPLPTRRVYIPKANGKLRPLGIVSYEDKIVQLAVKKILEAIYEPKFQNCMYGFRPKRGCHEAIKEVYQRVSHGKINYIVDADIKGFFDHIYYAALKERMAKFNLELEESKSRLIEFGRYAEQNRRARGLGKPETFDFLGFTFYYGKSRKGYPWPKVKTSRKKFEKKLREFKEWLYASKNQPAKDIVKQLNVKLVGYYRYYGVSFNVYKLSAFLHRVQQFLFKAMNRRGCRRTYTWNGFIDMLKYYPLAKPKVYYPLY